MEKRIAEVCLIIETALTRNSEHHFGQTVAQDIMAYPLYQ